LRTRAGQPVEEKSKLETAKNLKGEKNAPEPQSRNPKESISGAVNHQYFQDHHNHCHQNHQNNNNNNILM